jgi:hypothetical protein
MEKGTEERSVLWEAAIVLLLLAAFFLFRGWGICSWLLAQVDEISLLNQAHVPFLQDGCLSASYFPLSLVAMVWADTLFPYLRLITLAFHLAALLLIFSLLKPRAKFTGAVLASLAFVTSWYFLYVGRLFETGAITAFFGAAHFFFMARWLNNGRQRDLILSAVFAGLDLDAHTAPWVYYLPFFWCYLLLRLRRGAITWQCLTAAVLSFVVASVPSIYTVASISKARDAAYLTSFSNGSWFLVNIVSPELFLRTFASVFTIYRGQNFSWPGALTAVVLVGAALASRVLFFARDDVGRFFTLAAVSQLTLLLISPLVPNNEGHMSLLLMTMIILCALPAASRAGEIAGTLYLLTVPLFGLLFFAQHIAVENQRGVIQDAVISFEKAGYDNVLLSDGAYLKLAYGHLIKEPRERLKITICDPQQPLPREQIEHLSYLLLTTECEEWLEKSGVPLIKHWELNQLLEAHSRHGVALYSPVPEP